MRTDPADQVQILPAGLFSSCNLQWTIQEEATIPWSHLSDYIVVRVERISTTKLLSQSEPRNTKNQVIALRGWSIRCTGVLTVHMMRVYNCLPFLPQMAHSRRLALAVDRGMPRMLLTITLRGVVSVTSLWEGFKSLIRWPSSSLTLLDSPMKTGELHTN